MIKNICFSMILVLCLLFAAAHLSNAAMTCGVVDIKAAACVTYAQGKDAKPSVACCNNLRQLAQTVKNVDDKKAICRCLKAGVKNFAGVQDKLLSNIPGACHINVGFPVSMKTDCETIH